MRSATRNKVGRDSARLAWVRTLPCCACFASFYRNGIYIHEIDNEALRFQTSPTEAAHTGMHGLSAKSPDDTTIPLCGYQHHREGPLSYHVLGKRFWTYWDLDRVALLTALRKRFEEQAG
jgi:hypothetical protein